MKRISLAVVVVLGAAGVAVGCGGGTGQESERSSMPAQAPAPAAATQTTADGVEVTLTNEPNPPRVGENAFAVTVRQNGAPVTDADVAVEFFMAAMPSMNMAEMRNTIPLTHDGAGQYRGMGNVMMSGGWDVTVRVTRGGQEIAAPKFPVTAQ